MKKYSLLFYFYSNLVEKDILYYYNFLKIFSAFILLKIFEFLYHDALKIENKLILN